MTPRKGKRLVIDANIAHSAGFSDVQDSRYCRLSLDAVLDGDYVAVFNEALRREWKDHLSRYSWTWQRSMVAQRRVEYAEGKEFAIYLDRACSSLEHERWKDDLRKDFHLIQSALASGQTILSLEKNFPKFVAIASLKVREFSTLYYANPASEGEGCVDWIKAGAEKIPNRRIDVWVRNHLKS